MPRRNADLNRFEDGSTVGPKAFYESEEYGPYRTSRQEGSTGQFLLVAGEDVNKVARIA